MATRPSSTPGPLSGGTADILPAERQRASFDVEFLLGKVAGNRAERLQRFQHLFEGHPFDDQHDDDFESYEGKFRKSMTRVTAAFRAVRDNPKFFLAHSSGKMPMESMFEHNGIYVHFTMMMNFINAQATDEQKKKWLQRTKEGTFIGAYCQTELGHGSNVRGLETTATYIPETQEFEIHSPTLTSLKWWPTGMYACTHALVFANLILNGKPYGFHGFMVQLRGADGKVLPGIEVGEIGPKMNAHNVNIGYSRFTHVRIPRDYMFSKYSQVTPQGEYIAAPPKLSKYRYISLMLSRTAIISIAYSSLAKASTIAVRYSAVREQGYKDAENMGAGEYRVLDYQMQQHRLFKAVALAYGIFWNSRYIRDYITRVQKAIDKGDETAADDLPELHATLSGLKVVSTVRAHDAIEECRKCCGGQGFTSSSGVARISPDFSEWVTVEGEQVILSLQLARFLVKAVADVDAGKRVAASVAYIGEPDDEVPSSVPSIPVALGLMAQRARQLARRLAVKLRQAEDSGLNFDAALNSVAVLAYRAAAAHSTYVLLLNNHLAMDTYFSESPSTKVVLERLLELLCLTELSEQGRDWAGRIPQDVFEMIDDRVVELLRELRPDAVSLVDCFGIADAQLKSTLGRHDGNVYEAILDSARRNPLNKADAMVGWEEFSTVLDLDFLRDEGKQQHAVLESSKL